MASSKGIVLGAFTLVNGPPRRRKPWPWWPTATGGREMAVSVVKPQFDDAGHGSVSSETIFAAFDQALGTAPERPSNAATIVTADYQVSFLAHAIMEPMACRSRWRVRMPAAATANRCSCRTRSPTRVPTPGVRSTRSGQAPGDRCSSPSTASSRKRSSTSSRTRRRGILHLLIRGVPLTTAPR